LPNDGIGRIYSNDGSGEIDYDGEASGEVAIWPAWQDKGGWGLSRFGMSDMGFDGSAAVGFGRGVFGEGEFGFDADRTRWLSGELADGLYRFGVKVVDASGNESGAVESGEIALVRKAGNAEEITVASWEEGAGELAIDVAG